MSGPPTEPDRYVRVDYRGGPRDGEWEVWSYPLVCDRVDFPVSVRAMAAMVEVAPDYQHPMVHRYQLTDTAYEYDIVSVVPKLGAMIQHAPRGEHAYYLMRHKRPLILTYQP